MNVSNKPTFISLFAGCGGFDIGFSKAGFRSLGAFDIDLVPLRNLERYSSSPIYQTDLRNEVLPINELERPDIILSGSPCQGFSTIGKRNHDDPRNSLLLAGANIAVQIKPKVYIAENVLGVMSGSHKTYWDHLHFILRSSGYTTQDLKLNANQYGVPQIRKRIFLIAYYGAFQKIELQQKIGGVLGDVLKGVDGASNHSEDLLEPGSRDFLISEHIGQGQKLSNVRGGPRSVHTWDIPEVFGFVSAKERKLLLDLLYLRRQHRVRNIGDSDPVEIEVLEARHGKNVVRSLLKKNYLRTMGGERIDLVGAFNGKYRRLDINLPSCTVDTRFGSPRHFLHPLLNRGFSPREAARIQGFPDAYEFSGTLSQQYRMIGNAVPPPLSYELGKYVKKHLLKES